MVLRGVARGVALLLGLGVGGGLIYYVGGYLLPLPEPWTWIVAFILAASLLAALVLILVRVLKTSVAEFLVTAGVLVVSLTAFAVFLANFESNNLLVNRLVPFTGVIEEPYPVNPGFPVEFESLGDGRYRAVVTNDTNQTTSVWCAVEGAWGDAVAFRDFKVGPIPAGGSVAAEGSLAGTGEGPYSGGCRRKSY